MNTNPLSTNVVQRMKELGMSQKELAELSGISQPMVHKLVSGKVKSSAKILDLARALKCAPERLLYGVDPQPRGDDEVSEYSGSFAVWDDKTPLGKDELEVPFFTEVKLAAGNGIVADIENHGPKLRFSKSTMRSQGVEPAAAVCVKVSGNSMEPVLPNGSTVGIDTANKTIVDGKMYAINHDGMLRVKLLYTLPGNGLRLRSYNQDEYPDESYNGDQAQVITVIGKVFWYSVLL